MEEIKDRIKYLRKKELNYTQEMFSERLLIKRNSLAQIEIGRNAVTDRTIQDICREFNINEEWLRNGTGEIFAKTNTENIDKISKQFNLNNRAKEILQNFLELEPIKRDLFLDILSEITEGTTVSLPIYLNVFETTNQILKNDNVIKMDFYTSPVSAGLGNPLSDDSLKETKEYPINNITKQADFVVKVSGNSMEPTIYDKEEIFIKAQPNIENGEVGLFLYNGEAYCKRLVKENNNVILRSDNIIYPDIILSESDTIVTFGKVLLKK